MSKIWLVVLVIIVGILLGYSSSIVRSTDTSPCGACSGSSLVTKYGFPAKYYQKNEGFIKGQHSSTNLAIHPKELVVDLAVWFAASYCLIMLVDLIRRRRQSPQPEPEQA